MNGHFSRHAVGYATVGLSMIATATERLQDPSALDRRQIVILLLSILGAGLSTIVAYRATPGSLPAPKGLSAIPPAQSSPNPLAAALVLLLVLSPLYLGGCQSTNSSNAGKFLKTLAEMNVNATKIKQVTDGPFYNHTESATSLAITSNGFSVTDLSAEFNIPFPVMGIPLLHWELDATGISGQKVASLSALTGETPPAAAPLAVASPAPASVPPPAPVASP